MERRGTWATLVHGNPDHISLGFVLGLGLRLGVNMVILRMGGKVVRRLFNNNNNIFLRHQRLWGTHELYTECHSSFSDI